MGTGTMIAKFMVAEVKKVSDTRQDLVMIAVSDKPFDQQGTSEDSSFARWTPTGELRMGIDNPALMDKFANGQKYYLNFTDATAPANQQQRRYQCFDMYGSPLAGAAPSAEEAIQYCIDKLNADRAKAISNGLPESAAAPEVKTWDDLDKLSVCVASFTLQWEQGWKSKQPA